MESTRFNIFAPNSKSCYLGIKKFGDVENKTWKRIPMNKDSSGHFYLNASDPNLGLTNNTKYEYKFQITPPNGAIPGEIEGIFCTDPEAKEVHKYDNFNSVITYKDGRLVVDDFQWADESVYVLPQNHQLIIYELPLQWIKKFEEGKMERGIGTFQEAIDKIKTHIKSLGANAIQLLPTAESPGTYHWGYGTRNFFAPDPDFGSPTDFKSLVQECHRTGMRVFMDMVMSHSNTDCPLKDIDYKSYFIDDANPSDRAEAQGREEWGGKLFKFEYKDPIFEIHPAREFHKKQVGYWIEEYHLDGINIDSVNNIKNWDFIGEVKDTVESKLDGIKPYMCMGQDTPPRVDLVKTGRLQALWNDSFKERIRKAILGEASQQELEKMINPLMDGYTDITQIINYLGSHDIDGMGNERIMNFLGNHGIFEDEAFKRIRLAFTILLTAVGIPMIFAGDDFGDIQDIIPMHTEKQIDPVNWDRIKGVKNRELFEFIQRMTYLRNTRSPLQQNSCRFLHQDFEDGKKLMVYQRGEGPRQVIVVANFSNKFIPDYLIPNWPELEGRCFEWTHQYYPENVFSGHFKENIYPFEVKVYLTQ